MDAQTVIIYYNWLWSEMSPTKYKLSVSKLLTLNYNSDPEKT
jgi:hypothetical protein